MEKEVHFTKQEKRVISLSIHGLSYGEISYCLHVSIDTASSHLRAVREKMNVRNCQAIIAPAMEMGFDRMGNFRDEYLFHPEPKRTFRWLPWERNSSTTHAPVGK